MDEKKKLSVQQKEYLHPPRLRSLLRTRQMPRNSELQKLLEIPWQEMPDSVVIPRWEDDPNAEEWCRRNFLEAYQWARTHYIRSTMPLSDIAKRTGFTVRQLKVYANENTRRRNSWYLDRKVFQNALVREMVKDTKERCVALMSSMMDVIERRVEVLKQNVEEGNSLKVSEVKALVGAVKEVHEISQLESGDPTKIVQNMKLTREEILRKLKEADPLVNYEEDKKEEGVVERESTH